MRILHINCNYIGSTLHQLMIENLEILGYKNQVFVPTYDKKMAIIKPNDNVCVCECFKKWDRLFFKKKQYKIQKGLEANIYVDNYELIHAYTLFTDGSCARTISKIYKIPYVVAVRNTDVNIFFRFMPHLRKQGIQIMADAEAIFFLSDSYRKQMLEKYIPRKYQKQIERKTYIIPNGIDEFWFQNIPKSEKILNKELVNLIYAGKIDKNKNIITTQKAIKILRNQGYKISFTVVGRIQDQKEFRIIQKDPFTRYIPEMPKEDLIKLYRESDIFVMPSYTESFGLVYAEAMSQGLPVIYTKGQGFDGQFDEGVVGYHVNANSPEDVADGIRKVIEAFPEIQKNVVQAARKFRWAQIAEKYDTVYKDIV